MRKLESKRIRGASLTSDRLSNRQSRNPKPSCSDEWQKLSAMKDALHLCMRFALADLPDDARVLCVGVGSGAELLSLAESFPHWRFTAVDTSAKELEKCRQQVEAQSLGARCEFHEGDIETLPETALFDAATAVLVSHYLGDIPARTDFFRKISKRVRPGGAFVNADLSANTDSPVFAGLLDAWKAMLQFAGMRPERVENMASRIRQGETAPSKTTMEAMLESSGFCEPTLICQTLLIHAWCSKRCD
jgi:tRNA (cmo5U34)-methyltransferase